MSTTPWKFHLRPVTVVPSRTAERVPWRNVRDPHLKSYRPPSPMTTNRPILIPFDYNPVHEARIPLRQPGPERTNRVNTEATHPHLIILIHNFSLKRAKSAPNMTRIMAEMTAIHAPPVHPKKMVGQLVKSGRLPKGSINIPKARLPKNAPRQHHRLHPKTPGVSVGHRPKTRQKYSPCPTMR